MFETGAKLLSMVKERNCMRRSPRCLKDFETLPWSVRLIMSTSTYTLENNIRHQEVLADVRPWPAGETLSFLLERWNYWRHSASTYSIHAAFAIAQCRSLEV